jgi:hypothetical protein
MMVNKKAVHINFPRNKKAVGINFLSKLKVASPVMHLAVIDVVRSKKHVNFLH